MLYYRVKANQDNKPIYTKDGKYKGFLIGKELYTYVEISKKLLKNTDLFSCYNTIFDQVEISKKNIYWSFGARFEKKSGYDYLTVKTKNRRQKSEKQNVYICKAI